MLNALPISVVYAPAVGRNMVMQVKSSNSICNGQRAMHTALWVVLGAGVALLLDQTMRHVLSTVVEQMRQEGRALEGYYILFPITNNNKNYKNSHLFFNHESSLIY